jgi:hypothetical protein
VLGLRGGLNRGDPQLPVCGERLDHPRPRRLEPLHWRGLEIGVAGLFGALITKAAPIH